MNHSKSNYDVVNYHDWIVDEDFITETVRMVSPKVIRKLAVIRPQGYTESVLETSPIDDLEYEEDSDNELDFLNNTFMADVGDGAESASKSLVDNYLDTVFDDLPEDKEEDFSVNVPEIMEQIRPVAGRSLIAAKHVEDRGLQLKDFEVEGVLTSQMDEFFFHTFQLYTVLQVDIERIQHCKIDIEKFGGQIRQLEMDLYPYKMDKNGIWRLPKRCHIETYVSKYPLKSSDLVMFEPSVEIYSKHFKKMSYKERYHAILNRYWLRSRVNYRLLVRIFAGLYKMVPSLRHNGKSVNYWRQEVVRVWEAILCMLTYGIEVYYDIYSIDCAVEAVINLLTERSMLPISLHGEKFETFRAKGSLSALHYGQPFPAGGVTQNWFIDVMTKFIHPSEYKTWRLVCRLAYQRLFFREVDWSKHDVYRKFCKLGYKPFWFCNHFPLSVHGEELQEDPQNCAICVQTRIKVAEQYAKYDVVFFDRNIMICDRDYLEIYKYLSKKNVDPKWLADLLDSCLFHISYPICMSAFCWLMLTNGYGDWDYGNLFVKTMVRDYMAFYLKS